MARTLNTQINDIFFDEELRRAHLMDMWEHIVLTNPGKDNAYHNSQHMREVAMLALRILRCDPEFYNQTKEERQLDELICLLTCLWHDYGHSAGQFPDYKNIDIATNAFQRWWDNNGRSHQYLYEAGKLPPGSSKIVVSTLTITDKVRKALRCTEFPFKYAPFTPVEMAIRDADLLYTFSDRTGDIVYGLYLELKPKLPEGMTFRDFLGGQTRFHESVTLFTPIGDSIHKQLSACTIREQYRWADEHESAM